jgi:phosphatidate cytidylyltransferase
VSEGGRAGFGSSPPGLPRRLLTALILIPLALGSVVLGGRLYVGVIAAMTIFLLFEWTRIVDGAELQRGFFVLSAAATSACYFAAGGEILAAFLAAALGGALATGSEWTKKNPQSWPAAGAAYIILPAIAALWLRLGAPDGARLSILLFLCVWAADSGALLFGRALGGPKLAPRISPNKTWAGAGGALLCAGATGLAFGLLFGGPPGLYTLYGGVIAVAAVLGDLAESSLKRRYGMKDSGGAFPGHGGVLDRLDGFLFAVLALAASVLLLQGSW